MALGPTLTLFQPYFWDKAVYTTVMYSFGKTRDNLFHSESLLSRFPWAFSCSASRDLTTTSLEVSSLYR